MKLQLLIFPIALGLVLFACSEEKDVAEETPAVDTVIPLSSLAPPDAGTGAPSQAVFDDVIYREYAQLATQLPKKQNDSLLKAVIKNTEDPSKIKDELQKAIGPLRERQDSIARRTLAVKYGISLDSVNGTISRMKSKKPQER